MDFRDDGERIYVLWDRYARERDVDGLLSLYGMPRMRYSKRR